MCCYKLFLHLAWCSYVVATSAFKRSEYSSPSSTDDGTTARPWLISRAAAEHGAGAAVPPAR
jgi:hypothetical protein